MTVRTVNMDFLYGGAFRTGLPEAYERLILDAMRGDAMLTRADEIEEQGASSTRSTSAGRTSSRLPELRGGNMGPRRGGRAAACGRPLVAEALMSTEVREWTGRNVRVADIERELAELRRDTMDMRTSVMTHCAWAPQWQDASRERRGTVRATSLERSSCFRRTTTGTSSTPSCRCSASRSRSWRRTCARGDRAAPARPTLPGAGEHRPAAPAPGPAGVPPLAWQPASARARSSSSST